MNEEGAAVFTRGLLKQEKKKTIVPSSVGKWNWVSRTGDSAYTRGLQSNNSNRYVRGIA